MNTELILEYPSWYIVFCLLLGAGFSYLLYRNNKLAGEVSYFVRISLASLRFVFISLLSFFLLTPLLKSIVREVEKPIIIVAQDNSESIKLAMDSALLAEYNNTFDEVVSDLEEQFEVKKLLFGTDVSEGSISEYVDQQTDIELLLASVESQFANRNVGALVIATDGLYNKGRNPIYAVPNINVPLYTIALGDTTANKDISVSNVLHNKIAFLGNQFPVQVEIEARNCIGEEVVVKIENEGKVIFQEKININSEEFSTRISTYLNAEKIGLQRYSVGITALKDELNILNNSFDFYIDILEGRQRILLLSEGPHPDIAAIKESINNNDNYELDILLLKNANPKSLDQYNLIIVNQITANFIPHVNFAKDKNIPVLYLVGAGSDLGLFNQQKLGITISGNTNQISESQGLLNKNFTLFNLEKELKFLLKQLPPLASQFGKYNVSESISIAIHQKIGAIETENPLLYFGKNADQKYGVLIGEGIWKWRLVNYSIEGNHNQVDALMQKTIQYLALKEDKKRFRINYDNQIFQNKTIVINAQLYNQVYEMINNPDVTLRILNEEEEEFEFVFGRTEDEYRINVGRLPVGKYSFVATTIINGEELKEKGEFIVKPVQYESINLKANHAILDQMSTQSNGKFLYPSEVNKLTQMIVDRGDVKPTSYAHQKLDDLINLKWIFFLLVGLITSEWFIRKRNGAY
ncbi:hypothetical protein N9R81_06000 [Flavobacteriales bacterium]|nr:hypothetical protein [Flavobacteriales bacterium]